MERTFNYFRPSKKNVKPSGYPIPSSFVVIVAAVFFLAFQTKYIFCNFWKRRCVWMLDALSVQIRACSCEALNILLQTLWAMKLRFYFVVLFSKFKIVQSLLNLSGSSFYSLEFFFTFLRHQLFSISFTCLWGAFAPVGCERWFLFYNIFFFIAIYWYHNQCFAVLPVVKLFVLIVSWWKPLLAFWKFLRRSFSPT